MKTKRLIGALLMAALSATALAEWIEIERFEDGIRIYADRADARREGDTAEFRHLVRWNEPQEEPGVPPYRSTLVSTRYDCLGKHEQFRASKSFTGEMGNGALVTQDEDADTEERWSPISEGSMEEKLWRLACGGE